MNFLCVYDISISYVMQTAQYADFSLILCHFVHSKFSFDRNDILFFCNLS